MRKFSKILAVLLTLCLLCGVVVSLVASATEEETLLTPTLVYASEYDVETGGGGKSFTIDSLHGVCNNYYGHGVLRELLTDSDGRIYYSLKANTAVTDARSDKAYNDAKNAYGTAENYLFPNAYTKSGKLDVKTGASTTFGDTFGVNTDNPIYYMTFDYDIAFENRYFYLVDGEEVVTTDATKVKEMTKVDSKDDISATKYYSELGVPEAFNSYFNYYYIGAADATSGGSAKTSAFTITGSEADGYVLTSGGKSVKLASKAGVYDHITYVFEVTDSDTDSATSATNANSLRICLYVNGEYVNTVGTVASLYGLWAARMPFHYSKLHTYDENSDTPLVYKDYYSIAIDNVAANYYTEDDLADSGLDEFMQSDKYDTNFYGVKNIVANENYITNNYKDGYVVYGGKSFYFTGLGLAYAAQNLKDGETIKTTADVSGFETAVKNFFVDCDNGATFELSEAVAESYDVILYDEEEEIYLYVNNGLNLVGRDRLNITNDPYNIYNDFSTNTELNGHGQNMASDGSTYECGVLNNDTKYANLGYFRFYGSGGHAWAPNAVSELWNIGLNNELNRYVIDTNGDGKVGSSKVDGVADTLYRVDHRSNLYDTSYAVVDFDIGTDRYTFSFIADVARTTTVYGSKITAEWAETNGYEATSEKNGSYTIYKKVETLENVTVYKTVETIAEFNTFVENYAKNPESVNYTDSVDTKYNAQYVFNETDVVTGIELNPETITCTPAYKEGAQLSGYYMHENTDSAFKAETVNTLKATFDLGADGKWYLTANNNGKSILLSNKAGVTDHITIVYDNGHIVEDTLSYIIYVNGEYLTHALVGGKSSTSDYYCIRGIGVHIPNNKNVENYSYMMDNVTINWYRSDVVVDDVVIEDPDNGVYFIGIKEWAEYVSGDDVFGIDDLVAGIAKETPEFYSITKCSDAFYNENTIITNTGWVSVDGGKTILYFPAQIAEAIAALKEDDTIMAGKELYISTLPEGVSRLFVKLCNDNAYVYLTGDLSGTHIFKEYSGDEYMIRELDDSEKLTVTIKGVDGEVYDTVILAPGVELNIPALPATLNKKTGEVTGFDAWYIEDTDTLANGYTFTLQTMPESLVVVPRTNVIATISTYAFYTLGENGEAVLVGDVADYNTMTADSLISAIENLTVDNATLVLLYDGSFEIGASPKIDLSSSLKSFSIDLNGRDLVASQQTGNDSSLYDDYIFSLPEGITVNLYSSQAGGAIFNAKYPNASQPGQVWGNACVFKLYSLPNKTSVVKNVTVNVGAYDSTGAVCEEYAGNFGLYGGTLTYFENVEEESPEGSALTVNVRGAEFYHALRSSYAVFTNRADNIFINIWDSTFFAVSSSYGIFHDYTSANKYTSATVNAYNSKFLATDGHYGQNDGTLGKIFVTHGANSTAYFEGCTLIGTGSGAITFGPGNTVAGIYGATLKEGVVSNNFFDGNKPYVSYTFTHPHMYFYNDDYHGSTLVSDGKGGTILNPDILDRNNWVSDTVASGNAYMTYSESEDAPAYDIVNVTLYDKSDNVIKTVKWLKGYAFADILPSFQFEYYDAYDLQWSVAPGTILTEDTDVTLTGYQIEGNVKNMQANMTLKTDMKFNLYIPVVDGMEITGVEGGEIICMFTIDEQRYYVIQIDLTAGNFDAFDITVSFVDYENSVIATGVEATSTITIDYVANYANKLIVSSLCGSESAVLMHALIDYNVAVATYLDANFKEDSVASLVTFRSYKFYTESTGKHATKAVATGTSKTAPCACTVAVPEAEATDMTGIEKYITDATFIIDKDLGMMGMVLYVAEGYTGEGLTVTYTDVSGKTITALSAYNEDGGYVEVTGIKAAYIDNVMTITVGDSVGTYSLQTYIAEMGDAVPALANALLKYAVAAENYKK